MGVVPIVNENDTVSVSVSILPSMAIQKFSEGCRKSNLVITIHYLQLHRP